MPISVEDSTYNPAPHGVRMTKLAAALLGDLESQDKPVLSNYDLFRIVWGFYQRRNVPYLRGDHPTRQSFRRPRDILRTLGHITLDEDYTTHWRIIAKADFSPDDLVCSVDPLCYVSHLSAMQRYGLTNRRPEALLLTQPAPPLRRKMLDTVMEMDLGQSYHELDHEDVERAKATSHPATVRGRPISFHATKYFGSWVPLRGSFVRLATIGQTFLDMIDLPDRCGGMTHVLDVWREHATTYLQDIIEIVDTTEKQILKVRAGYVLEEFLNISDPRIDQWASFAQRGSSRVLDPNKPFGSSFSEKWMLSLNA